MVDVAEFIVNNWVWVLVFALLSFMHFSRRLSQWESDIKDSQNFDYFISAIVIIIVGTVSFGTYQLYTADLGEPQQYVDSVVRGDTGMLEMFVIFTMISVITFGILMIMNQTRRG